MPTTPRGYPMLTESQTYALVTDYNKLATKADAEATVTEARAQYLTDKAVADAGALSRQALNALPGQVANEVDRVIGDTREDAADARSIAQQAYEYNQALVAPAASVINAVITDPATDAGALVDSKVSVREAPLTPYRFGATPLPATGWVDNTAALTAMFAAANRSTGTHKGAEVYLPSGHWVTHETLPLDGGTVVRGASRSSTRLTIEPGGSGTTLFSYDRPDALSRGTMENVWLTAGGGSNAHLFDSGAQGAIHSMSFRNVSFVQYNDTKRIFNHTSSKDFIAVTWQDCSFTRTATSVVEPIYIKSYGGANCNTMSNCWWNGNHNNLTPFMYVETTNQGYCSDWVFSNIIGEQNAAGLLRMLGPANVTLIDVSEWDNHLDAGYTGDLFRFEKNRAGMTPQDITLIGVCRRGSFMADGYNDIWVDDLGTAVIINCNPTPPAQKAKLRIDSGRTTLLGMRRTASFPQTKITGPLSLYRQGTGNRPSAGSQDMGTMMFDATLNKPIWTDGTNWRDASGAVV